MPYPETFLEADRVLVHTKLRKIMDQDTNPREIHRRLLKVPLIFSWRGKVMLTDMRTVERNGDEPEDNRCLTVPFVWPERKVIDRSNAYLNRVVGVEGRRVLRHVSRSLIEKRAHKLGLFKDYPSDHDDKPTVVTVIPAYADFSDRDTPPETRYIYEKLHGKTGWLPLEDALEAVAAQDSDLHAESPNPLVLDSIELLTYFQAMHGLVLGRQAETVMEATRAARS